MDTLGYLVDKYKININQKSPFYIKCERFNDIPKLFNELGFKIGVEVGVAQGKYSECLLEGIPGLKLYGIDLWQEYDSLGVCHRSKRTKNYEKIARERTKNYNCELIKGWSGEVVKQFENGSLDFVFIDGNHAYEYAVEDIAKWSKKVRSGGIVWGHDFDDYSEVRKKCYEFNVINAVEGWTKSYKIHPWFVLEGNKYKSWMYVKE